MSTTETDGPRELATQLTDAARALRDTLHASPGPREPLPVLTDLIAAQGLLTQIYEELAAWHNVEAGVARPGDTSAATTAARLTRASQQSELSGVWLDAAVRSAADATTRAQRVDHHAQATSAG